MVGGGNQIVAGAKPAAGRVRGDADAAGHAEGGFAVAIEALGLDGGSNALGRFDRMLRVAFLQDDGHLFAAVAGGEIGALDERAEEFSQTLQDFVTGLMAVGVVDRFEFVDVEEEEGNRLRGLLGLGEGAGEELGETRV